MVRSDVQHAAPHKKWLSLAVNPEPPHRQNRTPSLIFDQIAPRAGWARVVLSGALRVSPYASSTAWLLFLYDYDAHRRRGVLTGLSNISTSKQERHHLRPPVIGRTVTAEEPAQRPSPVAKEASPAKDVSSFVATAKADTKKSKHYKPKVFAYKSKVLARQRNNHRYGNALGYAQEYGYGPRGAPFFQ